MSSPLITLVCGSYRIAIARMLVNLANALAAQDMRVDILIDPAEFAYTDEIGENVRIIKLPTLHRVSGIPYLLSYIYRNKPAVLLTPFIQLTVMSYRAKKLFPGSVKLFVNIRSTYSMDFKRFPEGKRNKHLADMKKFYPKCNGIIAISDGAADDFSRLTGIPRDEVSVIYNPVVTDSLIIKSKVRPDHAWFEPGQPPVILGVGRLVEGKNFDLLIQSFIRVRRERHCRLVILGDGELRGALESQAGKTPCREDIAFLGHQINPFNFMRYASLFVFASSYEGLGNVLIEALAVGTPVVSSDCPSGPREILDDGRYGALVPVGDHVALSEAILETLDHPPDSSILTDAAERFRDTRIARAYLSVFGFDGDH